jgi:hypothetical protein
VDWAERMDCIAGPAETLSSEFRLQQKRLSRDIQLVTSRLEELTVSLSNMSEECRLSVAQELQALEAKVAYLLEKEKETAFRAHEHIRICRMRIKSPATSSTMSSRAAHRTVAPSSSSSTSIHIDRERDTEAEESMRRKLLVHCGDYLLRKGYADCVSELNKEDGNLVSELCWLGDFLEEEPYRGALLVESALREDCDISGGYDYDGALQLAVGWCSQHGSRLRRLFSPLEFSLRMEQFIALIQSGRKTQAYSQMQEQLVPLVDEARARIDATEKRTNKR